MRTDTNGSSERSRFDLAQRVVLWFRSQGYTRKSRLESGWGRPNDDKVAFIRAWFAA